MIRKQNTMNAKNPRLPSRPSGAVMSEMVLALPFFFIILSLVLFLGRAVLRLQESHVADRYEAWREAAIAPGPAGDATGTDQLNTAFFRGQTESIDYQGDEYYPQDAMQALVGSIGAKSNDANSLINDVVGAGILDQGRHVVLTTHYSETNAIWSKLNQPISHGHVRIGTDWKFANGWQTLASGLTIPSCSPGTHVDPSVNAVFVKKLDSVIGGAAKTSSSPQMASMIQHLYTDIPAYSGPNFSKP